MINKYLQKIHVEYEIETNMVKEERNWSLIAISLLFVIINVYLII